MNKLTPKNTPKDTRPWKEIWLEKIANDPEIKSIIEENWEDILKGMGIDPDDLADIIKPVGISEGNTIRVRLAMRIPGLRESPFAVEALLPKYWGSGPLDTSRIQFYTTDDYKLIKMLDKWGTLYINNQMDRSKYAFDGEAEVYAEKPYTLQFIGLVMVELKTYDMDKSSDSPQLYESFILSADYVHPIFR